MKSLIENSNGILTVTSLVIANEFGRRHSNVIRSLNNLSEKGKISSVVSTSFSYKDTQNRKQIAYRLTERDFLVAMPFIGGDKSEDGQVKLVDEFFRLQKENSRLREQKLAIDWQEARSNSKCIRTTLTAAVQSLSELANKQGGEKNRQYYSSITKTIYKALFGDGSLKEVRDKLDVMQLSFLSICEQSCANELDKLVEMEIDYHDIYKEAKRRVINTVNALSQTGIASKNSNIKLAWENKT